MFLTRARFSFGCDHTIESQYFIEAHEKKQSTSNIDIIDGK